MIEKGIRKAIEQNQLEQFYQPRVNEKTERINNLVALIRWNHPEWGLVPPVEFIPFEKDGYIFVTGSCKKMNHYQNECFINIELLGTKVPRFLSTGF